MDFTGYFKHETDKEYYRNIVPSIFIETANVTRSIARNVKVDCGAFFAAVVTPSTCNATCQTSAFARCVNLFSSRDGIWDNCGISLKDRLQKYQNCAARVITGAT
jgi:hypothetical protein